MERENKQSLIPELYSETSKMGGSKRFEVRGSEGKKRMKDKQAAQVTSLILSSPGTRLGEVIGRCCWLVNV